MSDHESVGIGILGTGGIATLVAAAIDRADGARVAAFLSRDAERAAALAAQYPLASAHTSLDRLLADPGVDAVYVATPNALHGEQSLVSLAAGKHVLVEKPMALDVAEAEAMVAAAAAADRVLAVGFHLRFHPAHVELRRLLAAGALGEPTLVQGVFGSYAVLDPTIWQLDPALAGFGSLTGLGVHLLDLVPWLLGQPLTEVVALDDAADGRRSVESLLCCVARAGDALVEVTSSRRLANAANSIVVYGTTSRVEACGTIGVVPAGTLRRTSGGDVEVIALPEADHYRLQIEAFARAAAGGDGAALATGRDGLVSVRVTAAVAEAARSGSRVTV